MIAMKGIITLRQGGHMSQGYLSCCLVLASLVGGSAAVWPERTLTSTPHFSQVEEELTQAGLSREAMDGIISATRINSLPDLQQLLGTDSEAFVELQTLFSLAEGYGIAQYLQLDTSCVRGLAYYTGEALILCSRSPSDC